MWQHPQCVLSSATECPSYRLFTTHAPLHSLPAFPKFYFHLVQQLGRLVTRAIARTPSTCRLPSIISCRLISGVAQLRKLMSASMPPAIISAIWPAFEKGKASGDLLFFPLQVHTHKDLGIDVGPTQHFSPRPHRSARIGGNDSFCCVLLLVRDQAMSGIATQTRSPDPALQGRLC